MEIKEAVLLVPIPRLTDELNLTLGLTMPQFLRVSEVRILKI